MLEGLVCHGSFPDKDCNSPLSTTSPELRYIVKDRAPTGSTGTKVYVSLPSMYLSCPVSAYMHQNLNQSRAQVQPLVYGLHGGDGEGQAGAGKWEGGYGK